MDLEESSTDFCSHKARHTSNSNVKIRRATHCSLGESSELLGKVMQHPMSIRIITSRSLPATLGLCIAKKLMDIMDQLEFGSLGKKERQQQKIWEKNSNNNNNSSRNQPSSFKRLLDTHWDPWSSGKLFFQGSSRLRTGDVVRILQATNKRYFRWCFVRSKSARVHQVEVGRIHPRRLTWNTIMEVWKIIFLSKWVICRFHVNLPGCIPLFTKVLYSQYILGGFSRRISNEPSTVVSEYLAVPEC